MSGKMVKNGQEQVEVTTIKLDNYAWNYLEYSDRVVIKDFMVKKYIERVYNQKKRNVLDYYVCLCVEKIFGYINVFNSLPEDTVMLGGHPLSQWPVLNEFKDFVIPNSVRLKSGDRNFNDLLIRTTIRTAVDNKSIININSVSITDYTNCLSEFRSYFKKDASSDFVSLDTIRVDKSLPEVLEFIAYKGDKVTEDRSGFTCHYDSNPYVPIIHLTNSDKVAGYLFQTWYLNADIEDIYDMYIAKLFF